MIDEIIYAFNNVLKRKLRSSLTSLSILIGIASIFALVSFGLGIQNYVNVMSQEMGIDKLFILSKGLAAPGLEENFYLTKEDMDFVSKIKGVSEIMGLYIDTGEIQFKEQKKYGYLMGVPWEKSQFLEEAFTVKVIKGRYPKPSELNKAFLGYNYQIADKIFKRPIAVGDNILINGNQFEVVGFFEEVGNPQDDSNIYLTMKGFEALYPSKMDKFGNIILQAGKGVKPKELADKIQDKLRKHKGQEKGKEDFYVQTFEDLLQTFGNVINIINGVLVLIALISVFVAGINTMNTMYTAVLERTKEIGVMKAIGAKNTTIRKIFMIESGFLGLLGGLLGIALGYSVAKIGGNIAANAGYASLQPFFPWYLSVSCLLFAFTVGSLSGFLPAKQASQLKPVEALRYE